MTTFPTLYKRTSTGKIQMWEIEVDWPTPEGYGVIKTTYGLKDGKQQETVDILREGKNAGKINATTPLQQATAEAQSQWEKKLKRGYVQNLDDAEAGKVDTNAITGGVNPMLAKSFDKDGAKISFPAFVQPKLDGHRCVAIVQDGKATLWSRTRKPITGVPHIQRELEQRFGDRSETLILDGELYNHDYRHKFEELTSYIRQETPKPGHEVVQYWVYDLVNDEPFSTRASRLIDLHLGDKLGVGQPKVIMLPTDVVDDESAMMEVFNVYIKAGFEGLMLRNQRGLYKNSRSADLQKVKEFEDAEFEIVDVEEGRGKMAGRAIFVCSTANGERFNAKMVGALDDLAEYFVNKDKYIGKQLTVKYQGITNGNVPRFPVAMRLREDV